MKVTPRHYIGGDFDIDPSGPILKTHASAAKNDWLESRQAKYIYSAGRFAMVAALDAEMRAGRKVLIPDYLCEAQVRALQSFSIPFEFYPLKEDLCPNLEWICDKASKTGSSFAVLVIDYFGLIDIESVGRSLKTALPDSSLVADCVQAPLDLPSLSVFDYVYTSFRKYLPVPDGAELFTEKTVQLVPIEKQSGFVSEKILAANLKYAYLDRDSFSSADEANYLRRFIHGESQLDELNAIYTISKESRSLASALNLSDIRLKRIANSRALVDGLQSIGIVDNRCSFEKALLCIPLWVENRNLLRSLLGEAGVFVPVHWPAFTDLPVACRGRDLADHELGLVIDQRYSTQDMFRQAKILGEILADHPEIEIRPLAAGSV